MPDEVVREAPKRRWLVDVVCTHDILEGHDAVLAAMSTIVYAETAEEAVNRAIDAEDADCVDRHFVSAIHLMSDGGYEESMATLQAQLQAQLKGAEERAREFAELRSAFEHELAVALERESEADNLLYRAYEVVEEHQYEGENLALLHQLDEHFDAWEEVKPTTGHVCEHLECSVRIADAEMRGAVCFFCGGVFCADHVATHPCVGDQEKETHVVE